MSVKIRAQNFQSIKDATVEVDRFTVVTGQNNSGKTALQRATRGVFQNTGGTAFIREGETKTIVTVDFGEDGKVEWSKGTGSRDRPTYRINDGEPIHPGSAVPDEVAAFGVVPIQAGGQDVWPTIAPQFTGQVFLLDRPGSALAEAVADVERVGQLNRALRKSEGDRRQAASALKVRQADLVKHEAEAQQFDGLDEALAAVDVLEAKQKKLVALRRAIESLTDMRKRLDSAESVARKLGPVQNIMVPDPEGMKPLLDELGALRGLRDQWEAAKAEEARYKGVPDLELTFDETKPRRIVAALDLLRGFRERLREAGQRVGALEAEVACAQEDLVEAASQADEALAEIGACPLCGTAVGDAP